MGNKLLSMKVFQQPTLKFFQFDATCNMLEHLFYAVRQEVKIQFEVLILKIESLNQIDV